MFKKILIQILFLLISTSIIWADVNIEKKLLDDFVQLGGYIVMPIDGQYLVDLGSDSGAKAGMLISVPAKSQQIIHPITNEKLGKTLENKAILQITKAKNKYSYAKVLSQKTELKAGDKITTAQNFSVAFFDKAQKGQAFYDYLKKLLPDLSWDGYFTSSVQAPEFKNDNFDLVFFYDETKLLLYGKDNLLLKTYDLEDEKGKTSNENEHNTDNSNFIITEQKNTLDGQKKVHEMTLEKTNQSGLTISDFNGDNNAEIAIAYSNYIEIGSLVDGNWQTIKALTPKGINRIIKIDSVDLDKNGKAEIYVTAVDSLEIAQSFIVEYVENDYEIIASGINIFFREDPRFNHHMLLGQEIETDSFHFTKQIFNLTKNDKQVSKNEAFPEKIYASLYGFSIINNKNDKFYLFIDKSGKINIKNESFSTVYTSEKGFSSSRDYLNVLDETNSRDELMKTKKSYFSNRIVVFPESAILVAVNNEKFSFSKFGGANKSYLINFTWDGDTLIENWRTKDRSSYLVDFAVYDLNQDGNLELIQLLSDIKNKKSTLMVLPIPSQGDL